MEKMPEYLFLPEENGYITHFLYTGRAEKPCMEKIEDTNQLRYEKKLRRKIAGHEERDLPEKIELGEVSPLGTCWKYYYSYGDIFVDDSAFYTELCKVEMEAATDLISEEEMSIKACLFSCCAADIWVNGKAAGRIETPIYKPLQRQEITLPLKKGKNRVYIRIETAGIRDTRISFALQIMEEKQGIKISLPDNKGIGECVYAEKLLNSAVLEGADIEFPDILPEGSRLVYDTGISDFYKKDEKFVEENISGKRRIKLKEYADFKVVIPLKNSYIIRKFERQELCSPQLWSGTCMEPVQTEGFTCHQKEVFGEIGRIRSLTRNATDGFSLYPLLARYAAGMRLESDEKEIFITLDQIEKRMDCADFMTCALIRLIHLYEIPEKAKERMKRVMLNFRYWMDEKGQDAMCFWSENHSLMFYQTAYFFGNLYADDIFARSGKTGRELAETAKINMKEWLDDVCSQGFDEFNSGVYTPITLAAILNVVDFAPKELAVLARKAADILFEKVAIHCFDGVVISPQGRIYRDVLYPGCQALQSLVHFMDENMPYAYSEWLISLATSSYKVPDYCKKLMGLEGEYSYETSNAVVDIYKTKKYMLTSVESPRRDKKERTWEREEAERKERHHSYVKALNECFHGTMQFEPGVYGYQQHLWYAALASDLVVFANHPGGTCEDMAEVRPGYWFGNGIIPALAQKKNILGCIYVIPEKSPVHFTHLYWNEKRFDRTDQKEGWLFGQKGDSWLGVWCNQLYEDHNDMLYHCEKRSYGDEIAYLTVCGSREENGSFECFKEMCMQYKPEYNCATKTLQAGNLELQFTEHENKTQYVD